MKSGSAPAQPQWEGLQLHSPQHLTFAGPCWPSTPLSLSSHWSPSWGDPVCTGESEGGVSISNCLEQFTWGSYTCLLGQAQGTQVMGEVCVLSSHLRLNGWGQNSGYFCTWVALLLLIKWWKWRIRVSKIQIKHWYLVLLRVLSIGLLLSKWRMKQRRKNLNSD